jgi:2-isopropylmalate synthase
VLSDYDQKRDAEASGNGMIDAAIAAIAEATGVTGRLTDFAVAAVTGGGDALGDVVIQLDADGVKVSGRGVSTDVVEASARAYLNAVNKVVRLRERPDAREIEIGP